jgi:hypothetical protein
MIAPSKDAEFLNRVVNHPAVHPYVSFGIKGDLDLTALVADPRNVFLANEWGGFLFIRKADYVYEVHTQFVPEGRGKRALRAAKDAADYMFSRTDCLRIDTYVQLDNPAAEWLTRAVGFRKWGEANILGHACYYYVLTLKEWARKLDLCQPRSQH